MKRMALLLLLFLLPFAGAQVQTMAQPAMTIAPAAPVALQVEFHPGETVRYAFSLKLHLTSQVNPRAPAGSFQTFTPRQYEVQGEIAATFEPGQPGTPLRGSVQFQNLKTVSWDSTANVEDWEARMQRLEGTATSVTTLADGNLQLGQIRGISANDLCLLDIEDLSSIAQALLVTRFASQPMALGDRRESAGFPLPGMIKSVLKLSTITEYVGDVPIANRPQAEVRLTLDIPEQSPPVLSSSNEAQMLECLHGTGVWIYLLDLGSRQISYFHKTIQSETSYSVEDADVNAPIRVPTNLVTVNDALEIQARRVLAAAPPALEARPISTLRFARATSRNYSADLELQSYSWTPIRFVWIGRSV